MNNSLKPSEKYIDLTRNIGMALRALFESGRNNDSTGQMNINKLVSSGLDLNIDEMRGALSILFILGIVRLEEDGDVILTSRYARFFIGSISRYLIASLPIVDNTQEDDLQKKYIIDLTTDVEKIRKMIHGMDTPIHNRDIINIIVKGRQIRNWKERDVFLHVFHKKWNAYHLIGLGRKDDAMPIDQVAQLAMDIKLRLKPFQYELDGKIMPAPIDFTAISGSHGALTSYRIYTKLVKSFSVDLNSHLHTLIMTANKPDQNNYRWFTTDEIERCYSNNGEKIMESTARVLQGLNYSLISNSVIKATHLSKESGWFRELGNHIDIRETTTYGCGVIVALLFTLFSKQILIFLDTPNNMISNLSDIVQIIGGLVAIIIAIRGIKSSFA